ncbi:MAG: hypothetical protein R6U98_25720 [Pirellulaceae bacterium]
MKKPPVAYTNSNGQRRLAWPSDGGFIRQAVGLVRLKSCPTQAVLPFVGLAAVNVIRDRYRDGRGDRETREVQGDCLVDGTTTRLDPSRPSGNPDYTAAGQP